MRPEQRGWGRRGRLAAVVAGVLVAAAVGAAPRPLAGPDDPGGVVVIANASIPESVELARHYQRVRGLPEDNVVPVAMPAGETVARPEYEEKIRLPVWKALREGGWIEGAEEPERPARRHRMTYLVTVKGVPLTVLHDPAYVPPAGSQPVPASFSHNGAAVDAELALIAAGAYLLSGPQNNPWFNNEAPPAALVSRLVRTSRIDAPAWREARDLVTGALEAEATGLIGRAYVDTGGPHPEGDTWFEATAELVEELGYDVDVEATKATFGPAARFDQAVLYFGWYAPNLDGPMQRPGFRFAPGAVAFHLHSFSGGTLLDPARGWTGPLVARGAVATVGNVAEPFLGPTHRPQVLLKALTEGRTLGDAAWKALPVLSWQPMVVGDPLYRPFRVALTTQVARIDDLPAGRAEALALRWARVLERRGDAPAALAYLEARQRKAPGLALALAIAERRAAAGRSKEALEALSPFTVLKSFPADRIALAVAAARRLAAAGRVADAVRVHATVLAQPELWVEVEKAVLREAVPVAERAGDGSRRDAWARRLAELEAPAPKPAGG